MHAASTRAGTNVSAEVSSVTEIESWPPTTAITPMSWRIGSRRCAWVTQNEFFLNDTATTEMLASVTRGPRKKLTPSSSLVPTAWNTGWSAGGLDDTRNRATK